MIKKINGNAYGVVEYAVSFESEVEQLATTVGQGSVCVVLENTNVYMFDESDATWKLFVGGSNTGEGSGGGVAIDDTTIAKDKTWSSMKIEDYVLTNVGTVWKEIIGQEMIDSTMDGFLREVEILGNAVQNPNDLSDIQHLGVWNEEKQGYEIEITVSNTSNSDDANYEEYRTSIVLPCQLMKVGEVSDILYWDNNKGRYVVEKINTEQLNATSSRRWQDVTNLDEESGTENYCIFIVNDFSSGSADFAYNVFGKVIKDFSTFKKYDGECINPFSIGFRVKIKKSQLETPDLNGFKKWLDQIGGFKVERATDSQLLETNIAEQIKLPTYINTTYIAVNGGIQGSVKAKAPLDGSKVVNALAQENKELKSTNEVQDELINITMLATDEMFMMLEPLLPQASTLQGGNSSIINMYVAMVQRGLKTIDQVPTRYREQVKEILA